MSAAAKPADVKCGDAKSANKSINRATHPDPMHFEDWIAANKDAFQPPVNNKLISGNGCQFKVMVVGGPNTRTDYHINRGEEWFYMVKGHMILKVCDGGRFRDVVIKAGECFCLPGGVPHSPQRYVGTYGLVLEHDRYAGENDGLRWYCPNLACRAIVYEEYFVCEDLGVQLKQKINAYYSDETKRTCKKCGTIDQKVPILTVEEALTRAEANNKIADALPIDTKLPYIDPSHHPKPFALRPRIDAALAKASTVDVLHCREWKVAAVSGPQNSAAPFKPAKGSGLPSDVVLHTAATEEWIWQFAGSVTVRLLDGNALRSVEVGPGQIFLVPAGIPHSYERKSSESCGVVVTLERAASNGVKDSIGIFDITNLTSAPRPVNATDPVLSAFTPAATK